MSANEAVAPLPEEQGGRPYTAVVTGSDSGIGRAIAAALAGGGVDVGITYHQDAEGAKRTAEEVREQGVRAAVRHLDLTDLPTSTAAIDEFAEELGGLDVLVNCAGTGSRQLVMDMDFDAWRRVMAFLATPAAGYVTGASYVVDGGMLLMGPQASSLLGDDAWRRP